jgi:D-glycerate 3-kinase
MWLIVCGAFVTGFSLLGLVVCSGPLLKKIGFDEGKVAQRIDEWLTLGVKLSRQLRFDEFGLSHSEKVRIYHYYVPVFLWCKGELDTNTSKFKEGEEVPPLVVNLIFLQFYFIVIRIAFRLMISWKSASTIRELWV